MGGSLRFGVALAWFALSIHSRALAAPWRGEAQPVDPVLGPYRRPPPETQGPTNEDVPVARYRGNVGGRLHDGFYFRLAGGLGFGFDALTGDRSGLSLPDDDGTHGHASGFAVGTEVAFGTGVWRGLVLALACDTALLPAPSAEAKPEVSDYEFEASQFALFGPVIDFYFVQDKGFHAQAGFGLAVFVAGLGTTESGGKAAQPHTAVGPGFMLGLGHEWWLAEPWGLGLLGRMTYGWMNGRDPVGVDWSHAAGNVTVLLSATYQ
jgi:hypothetical protein